MNSEDIESFKIIAKMCDKFIFGIDRSKNFALQISARLDDYADDDEYLDETRVALSCYQPGGGEFLFNEKDMLRKVIALKAYVNKLLSNNDP